MEHLRRWMMDQGRNRARWTAIFMALLLVTLVWPTVSQQQEWAKTQIVWLWAFALAFQFGGLLQAWKAHRAMLSVREETLGFSALGRFKTAFPLACKAVSKFALTPTWTMPKATAGSFQIPSRDWMSNPCQARPASVVRPMRLMVCYRLDCSVRCPRICVYSAGCAIACLSSSPPRCRQHP
jgi:hypothetical protein